MLPPHENEKKKKKKNPTYSSDVPSSSVCAFSVSFPSSSIFAFFVSLPSGKSSSERFILQICNNRVQKYEISEHIVVCVGNRL